VEIDRPPEGSTLDRRTLGRTLLARQLLLERVDAEPVAVAEQLVSMQAQVPLSTRTSGSGRASGGSSPTRWRSRCSTVASFG